MNKTEAELIFLAKQMVFVFQRHVGADLVAQAIFCMSPAALMLVVKEETIWPEEAEGRKGLEKFFADVAEANFTWPQLMDYSTRK